MKKISWLFLVGLFTFFFFVSGVFAQSLSTGPIEMTQAGKRLDKKIKDMQYEITRKYDETIYFVTPEELMENYKEIRDEAKYIKKCGTRGDPWAVIYLTSDPSKAEAQQINDNTSAYIYTLKDFNKWVSNRNTKINPIGETKVIGNKTVEGRTISIIERKLYKSREVVVTTNWAVKDIAGWLPFGDPD